MRRPLTVGVALLVACSVLATATFATGVAAAHNEIDSCTVIDDPGEYELVDDIETNESGDCIEIRADNVTIDGNGHVLAGPGADSNATGIAVGSDGDNRNLSVRNVEIAGWERGLEAGGNYRMTDAVVRDSEYGLYNDQGGADHLQNVTVAHNELGIYAQMGGASGTDVTVRDNGVGIHGTDGGFYEFESSRIVDNDDEGANVQHSSGLTLNDSTVSGNGGHGIYFPFPGYPVQGYLENTTVADNGGDGIRAASETHEPIRLVDVTVEDNEGLEVNAAPNEDDFEPLETTSSITADGLQVGLSATTAFEEEAIRLEPVDRESLPDRENGTAVGDGLNVSGNVSGPVDLELDVDTDDDTVDLWRHDGSEWETLEEDLTVSDGSVEATVDDAGVYAPGTDDEQNDTGDGDDQQDGEDDQQDGEDDQQDGEDDQQDGEDDQQDGEDDQQDGEDDQQDDEDDSGEDDPSDSDGEKTTPTPSDTDGEKTTPTPSDTDGEKTTPTPADADGEKNESDHANGSSDCGCPSSDDDEPTATDTPQGTDESTPGDETTASPGEAKQQGGDEEGDDSTTEDGDDGSLADGPGFGAVAALLALLATVLASRRRS